MMDLHDLTDHGQLFWQTLGPFDSFFSYFGPSPAIQINLLLKNITIFHQQRVLCNFKLCTLDIDSNCSWSLPNPLAKLALRGWISVLPKYYHHLRRLAICENNLIDSKQKNIKRVTSYYKSEIVSKGNSIRREYSQVYATSVRSTFVL